MEENEKDSGKTLEEKALEKRLSGHLPTLDIAGDVFWIDVEMNCLRPKSPLISNDISFARIQGYFSWTEDKYIFTYNSTHHEPQEVNFSDLYHIPASIHLVEFPSMERLDPVGYARKHGYDIQLYMKQVGTQSHFKTNAIPVKESLLRLLEHKKQKHQKKQQFPITRTQKQRGKGLSRSR